MAKPVEFRKILGHRVYLEIPAEPKSDIILDEASKAALEAERLRKWGRLRVYAVGEAVTDLKQGDIVMIDPSSMSRVYRIPITADKDVLLVSLHDIAHIW